MADNKELAARLRHSVSVAEFVTEDKEFAEAKKKIHNFDSLIPFFGARQALITDYEEKLSDLDKRVLLDLVNRGVLKKDRIQNIVCKIIYGWERGPATIEARMKTVLGFQLNSINSGLKGQKIRVKNEKGEIEEENAPKSRKIYSKVEDLELNNGFKEAFAERMKEMMETYQLDAADKTVLRLLVSSEVELEHVMYKQAIRYSDKGLTRCDALMDIIKTCLETLKLARRQRNDKKDDSVEKDIAEKYKENRDNPKVVPDEELKSVKVAKKAIEEFILGTSSDEDDVQELCPLCMDISCDGTCQDGEDS
jgi:hypothetical protein